MKSDEKIRWVNKATHGGLRGLLKCRGLSQEMQRPWKRNDTYFLLILLDGSSSLGGDEARAINDWRDWLDRFGLGLSEGRHYVV